MAALDIRKCECCHLVTMHILGRSNLSQVEFKKIWFVSQIFCKLHRSLKAPTSSFWPSSMFGTSKKDARKEGKNKKQTNKWTKEEWTNKRRMEEQTENGQTNKKVNSGRRINPERDSFVDDQWCWCWCWWKLNQQITNRMENHYFHLPPPINPSFWDEFWLETKTFFLSVIFVWCWNNSPTVFGGL